MPNAITLQECVSETVPNAVTLKEHLSEKKMHLMSYRDIPL